MPGLRPKERGLELARVAYAGRAPIPLDLIRMHRQHVVQRQIVGHRASFW
jgi:hypothetical protein